jgi:hypothetical protein
MIAFLQEAACHGFCGCGRFSIAAFGTGAFAR